MTKNITPYELAYHLAASMDGDWDDGIERFVGASSYQTEDAMRIAGQPAQKVRVTLEPEEGEAQFFELIIIENRSAR